MFRFASPCRCHLVFPLICLQKLYGNVVPETVKNFEALLTGQNDAGVSYKGTEAYKVLDGLNIQVPILPPLSCNCIKRE